MPFLSWLFGRRSRGSIPIVYPIAGPAVGTGSPTVFGPDVHVTTYKPEAVVYGEGELFERPEESKLPINKWINADSSAIRAFKFQMYEGQKGIGSIWIRFKGGTKSYNYPNVPWREFVELYNAPSQGRFVNFVLRPLYSVGIGRTWRTQQGRSHVRATTARRARRKHRVT